MKKGGRKGKLKEKVERRPTRLKQKYEDAPSSPTEKEKGEEGGRHTSKNRNLREKPPKIGAKRGGIKGGQRVKGSKNSSVPNALDFKSKEEGGTNSS